MQAFLIWKLCFSEHFSSGFEPKYPNQGRRLSSSWRGSREPLTLSPGTQVASSRGLLLFNSVAHSKPEGHWARPRPSVSAEQRPRTASPAKRGFIPGTSQPPSSRPCKRLQEKLEFYPERSLPPAFQTRSTPEEEIRRKGCRHPTGGSQ